MYMGSLRLEMMLRRGDNDVVYIGVAVVDVKMLQFVVVGVIVGPQAVEALESRTGTTTEKRR